MELKLKDIARERLRAVLLHGECPELYDLTDCGDCPLAAFDNEHMECAEIAERLIELLESQ